MSNLCPAILPECFYQCLVGLSMLLFDDILGVCVLKVLVTDLSPKSWVVVGTEHQNSEISELQLV